MNIYIYIYAVIEKWEIYEHWERWREGSKINFKLTKYWGGRGEKGQTTKRAMTVIQNRGGCIYRDQILVFAYRKSWNYLIAFGDKEIF